MQKKESEAEDALRRGIMRMGGIAFKFVSPGNRGVPDRLIALPGGRAVFVEMKRDTGTPGKLQVWQHKRLRSLGFEVYTVYGQDGVRDLLAGLAGEGGGRNEMQAARIPAPGAGLHPDA